MWSLKKTTETKQNCFIQVVESSINEESYVSTMYCSVVSLFSDVCVACEHMIAEHEHTFKVDGEFQVN